QEVRVVATTTDALGGKTVFTGEAETIANVDDAATGTLGVTGTALFGSQLTANLAGVADADGATTTTYQWQVNRGTAQAPNWQNLDASVGANGATLAAGLTVTGREVRVVATTTDALGGQTVFTSEPQLVFATPAMPLNDVAVDMLVQQGDAALDALVDRLQAVGMQSLKMSAVQALHLAEPGTLSLEAGLDVSVIGTGFLNHGNPASMAAAHALLGAADVSVRLSEQDLGHVLHDGDAAMDALLRELQAAGMD
ncbi:hypothetical protein, partial [Azohydromonas australica]|uniref:hypothetical protein n=1 Tax=Azohydromonas australica TaxID=364039 RepID=UPI0005BCFD01